MVLVTESYGDRSFIAWATKQWQSHLEWWRSQGITIEVKRWITGSILAEKSLKLQLDGLTCRREVWSGDCIWVLNLCLNVYVLVKVIEMGETTWCIYSTGTTIMCVCVCVCVCVLVTQSCPTLCNPTTCAPPDFSVHGILQARILEWTAFPFSRGSSWPRDWIKNTCD